MRILILGTAILGLGLTMSGCGPSRVTTTEKTAIERALMWQSLDPAIAQLDPGEGNDKTFNLQTDEVDTEYQKVIVSRSRQELLEHGYKVAGDPAAADVVVHARADYAGLDESGLLIGIPAIPIVTPGGTLSTPELALFKRENQRARNQVSFYGVDKDGNFIFADKAQGKQTYYTSWKLLIFFGFRTTNLEKPF
jgi:hypothetical protein